MGEDTRNVLTILRRYWQLWLLVLAVSAGGAKMIADWGIITRWCHDNFEAIDLYVGWCLLCAIVCIALWCGEELIHKLINRRWKSKGRCLDLLVWDSRMSPASLKFEAGC